MNIFLGKIAETPINLLTLSFFGATEQEYLERYRERSLVHVRFALAIGIVFYSVFGILDATLAPAHKYSFWIIRYAVLTPYFLFLILFSFSSKFKKYMQFAISLGVLIAGLGIIWMIIIGPEAIQKTYYTGLILVFFFGYTFLKIRFVWATLVGWSIVFFYEFAAIGLTNTEVPILINNNFFFIAGNFIGMFVSYSMEYSIRKEFISERLLEAEKRKIDEINLSLEIKVEKRTNELLNINKELEEEIAERKRTEELLHKSEQQYRSLFEESQDAIFISSPEGKILEINPAGIAMLGYESKEEVLNIDIAQDLYFDEVDRKEVKRILAETGRLSDYEIFLKRKDNQKVIVRETSSALTDGNGKIVAYHGIFRDVTEKEKLKDQLFQIQKMESIGMLAGGVAHDFNNILTAINGYSELILLKMDKKNPFYESVHHIRKGGERANNLTRQLLAFSRKQVYQLKVVDINTLIVNLEKMIYRLIGEDIHIKKDLASEIHTIKADPGQIEQILVNLVINARDAINQNKSTRSEKQIVIHTENFLLDQDFVQTHAGSRKGDFVLISINDSGIGMDKETQEKIFEPFFTTKELGKGTGLGLSTVYGIVKQNKASIYVESELDKGTTFKIYWPSEGQVSAADVELEPISELKSGSETILYVEDDIEVRQFTAEALQSLGYTIIEAENGKEALSVLGNHSKKIDLLFTDLVMPEMGGKELSEIIKKIDPSLKILITSGYSDNHVVQQGILTKKVNFIQKPYTFQEISKKIRKILDD